MSVLDAVETVLTEAGVALHYEEVTSRILKRGLWMTEGKTPSATINARLSMDIKTHGLTSRFQRVGKGIYSLRAQVTPASASTPAPAAPHSNTPEKPPTPPLKTLSFTDAAERVLEHTSKKSPLHYRDITKAALEQRLISTAGLTPEATLYAQVLTEIKRQQQRGETPRFVKHGKGMVGLSRWMPSGLDIQIEQHYSGPRCQDTHTGGKS